MVKITKLTQIDIKDLRRLVEGYTSNAKYEAAKFETEEEINITLRLVPLDPPYFKRWGVDDMLEERYPEVLKQGHSLGAYDGNHLIGIAIAEKRDWNRSLWVWEFHVEAQYRGKGIGHKLMNSLVKAAKENDCRVIVCEVQNTNVPAIGFYRRQGFEIDGLDLSYYSNSDPIDYEVAIFMKKKLD
jgi:ribosomal protein S18 acetylase RimI-like enzyme